MNSTAHTIFIAYHERVGAVAEGGRGAGGSLGVDRIVENLENFFLSKTS